MGWEVGVFIFLHFIICRWFDLSADSTKSRHKNLCSGNSICSGRINQDAGLMSPHVKDNAAALEDSLKGTEGTEEGCKIGEIF